MDTTSNPNVDQGISLAVTENVVKNAPLGKQKEKSVKITLAEKERDLTRWLDGKLLPYSPKEKPFDNIFHVWHPDNGEPQILQECPQNRTVKLIPLENVASHIVEAVSNLGPAGQIYGITYKQALDVAKRWRLGTKRILPNWPKPIVFKSSPDIAFARLDYDPADNYSPQSFPIISEMLGRMSNSKAFCAKIGAMLTPGSDRKQVIWLYGDGDSGKSFLLNKIIAKVCGGTAGTAIFSGDSLAGPHWKEVLLGKTLLVANEAPAKFLSSSAFKALTGDEHHYINPKGQKAFTAAIDCHFVFSSNEAPQIPNEGPIKSRLIVCKMTKVPEDRMVKTSVLEAKIQSELPFFLAHCLAAYQEFDATGVIATEGGDLDVAIAEHEAELHYIVNQCFVIDPIDDELIITTDEIVHALQGYLKNGMTLKRIQRFLNTEYGLYVSENRKRFNGVRKYFYQGIGIKPECQKIRLV